MSLTRGNGAVTSYGYDAVSRLASLGHDLAGTLYDVTATFTHDPASGIASRTRDHTGYAYVQFVNGSVSDTINGLNQVTATGGASVSHDARGNITAIGSTGYGYDVENWMTYGWVQSQLYPDPAGRLIRTVGAADTRFAWDGNDLALELDPSGNVLRRYVHGPGMDEPLIWYEGSGTADRRWLHADERGSVIAVSNGSGSAILTYSFDEYGVPGGGVAGRFGYTGQLWLPELAAYYYKARIYNPVLGRFMQTDPIGYGDGLNLYAYVKGDPVNKIDPTGKQGRMCWMSKYETSWTTSDGTIVINAIPFEQCAEFGPSEPGGEGGGGGVSEKVLRDLLEGASKAVKEMTCSLANSLLGDSGRLRLGADGSGGAGSYIKAGAGVSVRGDLSLEFDAYLGGGAGAGVLFGAGLGVDNAGGETRGGNMAVVKEFSGGVGYKWAGMSASIPIGRNLGNPSPTLGVGASLGPKLGASLGATLTATGTYRTQGICQ